jgi:diacylglycerol kinase (ATP)
MTQLPISDAHPAIGGTMPRFKFILCPASDRGDTAEKAEILRQAVNQRIVAGGANNPIEVDWVTTEYPTHATELAEAAAREGYDVVVATGGDGTVHEVVNGLMAVDEAKRPMLGVLPVGSGNDFAFNVGIPISIEEAVQCVFSQNIRKVDIGTIRDGGGRKEYWNNTISIGFGGAVSIESRKLKNLRGFMVYLVAVLKTILFKPQALHAEYRIGSGDLQHRDISMLSLCNGPREGGGFPVAPDAIIDDGLLTYMIMSKVNRAQMLYFLPIVMSAKHPRYKKVFEGGHTESFIIETDKTMAIHADGEIFGPWEADVRKVEVTMIPAALRVLTC